MGLKKEVDIENYIDLLNTIFNTDIEKDVKSVICVYDTKKQEKLVAVFNNAISCAKFFNTSSNIINTIVCKGQLRWDRYRLERVKVRGE